MDFIFIFLKDTTKTIFFLVLTQKLFVQRLFDFLYKVRKKCEKSRYYGVKKKIVFLVSFKKIKIKSIMNSPRRPLFSEIIYTYVLHVIIFIYLFICLLGHWYKYLSLLIVTILINEMV